MLLVLVIILMLIWASIVGTIYSNFLVFYSNFSEGENYHKAYYSAISALERGELVVKQRGPWYIWSGGFIMWAWTWSTHNSDWWSDKNLTWFSYLWDNSRPSSIFRTVTSRATRIPAEWQWNVERMLSASDSNNYNMMNYEDSEIFLLYYDKAEDRPYKKVNCKNWNSDCANSSPTNIIWQIRLPEKLRSTAWWSDLDTSNPLTKLKNEAPADDPIIDRQVRWYYGNYPFTVYSSQSESKDIVIYPDDTVIREKDINRCSSDIICGYDPQTEWIKINVSNSNYDRWKIFLDTYHWKNNPVTIISQIESNLKSIWWIKDLIGNAQEPQIRFSLLNLLKWRSSNTSSWHIYPFLEYRIDFQTIVPDRFYKINAEWNFADYKINLIVHKPTVKETVLGNFTSIFGR